MQASRSIRRRSRSGHTLIELVVVVCLMSVGSLLAMRGTIPFYGMVNHIKERAESAQELMMAREFLRFDLGGALTALPTKSGGLAIVREPDVAAKHGVLLGVADLGIQYRFANGQLFREDMVYGETMVVADNLEGFVITRVGGFETRIQLVDGSGKEVRTVTLVWPK